MTEQKKSKEKLQSEIKESGSFSIEKGLLAFLKKQTNPFGNKEYNGFSDFIIKCIEKAEPELMKEYENLTEPQKIILMGKYWGHKWS